MTAPAFTFSRAVMPDHVPTPDWKIERRIVSRVDVSDSGCWLWVGATVLGYGQIAVNGRRQLTHRIMCALNNGPIPAGYDVDHLCRVKLCCNPAHLEAVTPAENRKRQGAAVTHCPLGHEYTPANTYITSKGGRSCRECTRMRNRRDKRARTAARRAAA